MHHKRHILAVAVLLGLSCLVQVVVICRATVPALDAVRFAHIAQEIDRDGLLPTLRAERQQPLFPAWVWVVHQGLRHTAGGFPSIWATCVQLAAAIALVLAVVPLYFALLRLVGGAAALAGACFFCLLPEVSRLGADGISDSLHLLFFCLAFWAMVEYFTDEGSGVRKEGFRVRGSGFRTQDSGDGWWGRTMWLVLAGAAVAMAVLARTEVLVLAGAFALVLIAFQFLPGRRQTWRRLVVAAGCFALGMTVVLGPYLAAMRVAGPKEAVLRILGRHSVKSEFSRSVGSEETVLWRMADGEWPSFDVKEQSVTLRRRGYAAAVCQFGKKLADAFGYWVGALALFGMWRLRHGPTSRAHRFVQIFFLLFCLAVIRFAAAEGYLAPRHLMALVVAGLGSAGVGGLELGCWMAGRRRATAEGDGAISATEKGDSPIFAARKSGQSPAARKSGQSPAARKSGQSSGTRLAWVPVVLAGVACLPQMLVHHHHSRLGHREAGRWLAEQGDPTGAVLDTRGWSGLYSGLNTHPYAEAPAALSDPRLRYVVVGNREFGYQSRRSRTLRWLVETAAAPVVEFPDPAVRKPNQQPVTVYQWAPRRFARRVAGSRDAPLTKEHRHARTNSSVRR